MKSVKEIVSQRESLKENYILPQFKMATVQNSSITSSPPPLTETSLSISPILYYYPLSCPQKGGFHAILWNIRVQYHYVFLVHRLLIFNLCQSEGQLVVTTVYL